MDETEKQQIKQMTLNYGPRETTDIIFDHWEHAVTLGANREYVEGMIDHIIARAEAVRAAIVPTKPWHVRHKRRTHGVYATKEQAEKAAHDLAYLMHGVPMGYVYATVERMGAHAFISYRVHPTS